MQSFPRSIGYDLLFSSDVKLYKDDILSFSGIAYVPEKPTTGLENLAIDVTKFSILNLQPGQSQPVFKYIDHKEKNRKYFDVVIFDTSKKIDLNNGEYLLQFGSNDFVVFNHAGGAFEGDSFNGLCKSSEKAANIPSKYKSSNFNSNVKPDSNVFFDCKEKTSK